MAKKNKLWFSGEDAQLAARFTKFMTKVLYARRASYIRALMVKAKREVSIEECRDEVDTVYRRLMNPIEESVESKLMWEGIKKYLHKLTPKECEVMISLYVDHLSVRETAAKLKVDDSTTRGSELFPMNCAAKIDCLLWKRMDTGNPTASGNTKKKAPPRCAAW